VTVPIVAQASSDADILPCPACGSAAAQPVWDRFRGDTGDRAVACTGCGLVRRARGRGDHFDSNEFYTGRYRTEYFAPAKRDFARMVARAAPYQDVRLDRLGALVHPGVRLLEIGCGPGYFLAATRKQGATVAGIELDIDQARFGAAHYSIEIATEPVEADQLAAGSWDLICLFQVLEHCADPLRFLAHVRRLLAPGGHLAIEVPDLRNPLVSLYAIESFKSFWYQRPHELYFESATLRALLARAGFATRSLRTFQEMGLVNHMNWMIAGAPMRDRAAAIAGGLPVDGGALADPAAFAAVDALFREADARYRQALEDRGFGDILLGIFTPS
jgi:2-polyprenyl-3-methyl-5-hydroxy-6-metoxy-1,4-benzoquinol methylase